VSARGSVFHIVDVFGKGKYSGNQLAVVRLKRPVPDSEMRRIAAEFNFAETTFIPEEKARRGVFPIRIFTPKHEVPFAGHPTLGTAYVIRNKLLGGAPARITLSMPAGKIPVEFEDAAGLAWMKQNRPVFGKKHPAANVARILGLNPPDIDPDFPVQEVSTGLPFLLVPLLSLKAVRKAGIDAKAYGEYFAGGKGLPILVFTRETVEKSNHLHCRMFAPAFGIPEDAATGSANGCLAAYLLKGGYMKKSPINFSVEQGYEMGRKSVLHIKARPGKVMDIRVGGKVSEVAEGILK
jgi:trans-2,3-dihydro-3-hydroxyanthranilate isomerase